MTVQSVMKGADPQVLHARFTDGSFFIFRIEYLAPDMPLPFAGLVLSDDAETAYRRASEVYAVEIAALRLTSLREHSRFLLSLKLRRREFDESAIRIILDRLESQGLLDDDRFARLWLESRISAKSESRSKLLAGLLARGVSRDAADRAVKSAMSEDVEIEAARRFAKKKKIDTSGLDASALKTLRAAGFSAKTIRAAFSAEKS